MSVEKDMATTPVFLPGEPHGHKSLTGTVHGAEESDMTEVTQHVHQTLHMLSDVTRRPRPHPCHPDARS